MTAGRGCGAVVQALKAAATTASKTGRLRRIDDMRICMWLLLVEAGVALFLLVFIVWWTMYQGQQPSHDDMHDEVKAPETLDAPATKALEKTERPGGLER